MMNPSFRAVRTEPEASHPAQGGDPGARFLRVSASEPARRGGRPRVAEMFSLVVAGLLLASAGCNEPPAVNPWRDDSLTRDSYSTPSKDGIMAYEQEPAIRQRDMAAVEAPRVSPDVPHYPLWWEDPLEDKGDQNNEFAWTWQDYVAMPYSFGRYLLNTMAWPVSAVVTLPGTSMVSDGITGRDHDARVGRAANPVAGPEDFGFPGAPPMAAVEPQTQPAP